jgi:hypothetical protein
VNACFNNDGVGDDEFTFIITGKGAVLLSQRHQIDTSYFEHAPFHRQYVMVSYLKGNTESFHQRQTLAQSTKYSDFVCKIVWGSSYRWKGNEVVHC